MAKWELRLDKNIGSVVVDVFSNKKEAEELKNNLKNLVDK